MLRKFILIVLVFGWILAACASTPQDSNTPVTSEPAQGDETPLVPPSGGSLDGGLGGGARSPLDKLPNESEMVRGPVMVDTTELLILESDPIQVRLNVTGGLPTPCYQLRADVNQPEGQNRIDVELYSLADPDTICAQVIQSFETTLELGSFSGGEYEIYLNGEKVGDFSA